MKLDLTPLLPARPSAAWLATQIHHPDAAVRVVTNGLERQLVLSTPDLRHLPLAAAVGADPVFQAYHLRNVELSDEARALLSQLAEQVAQTANDALVSARSPLELPAIDVTGMTAPAPAAPAPSSAPAAAPAAGQWAVMLRSGSALPYALLAPSKRAAQLLGCEQLLDGGHLNARLPEVQEFSRELSFVRAAGNGPSQALYDAASALQPLLSGTGMMSVGPVHEVNPYLQP